MQDLFGGALGNQTILVTGHTGFKGSWLTLWLVELGANVVGYSLPEPPTIPSNFEATRLDEHITDIRGDIRDLDSLKQVIETHRPQLVFHLAAQPIVLRSIEQPKITFDTNAGGTVNVLEAIRTTNSVKALVCITTDKVYENREWLWGYRENDRLGGHEPYSASKSMAELAIAAYRETYFPVDRFDEHGVSVASVRAGNVIGGGDFADFRLVPDSMKALMKGEAIQVRNPHSIRPWQFVLEPLSGYLWLAVKLLQKGPEYAEAWNFGPLEKKGVTAGAIAEKLVQLWGSGSWQSGTESSWKPTSSEKETGQLRLSWDKAASRLNWRPVYAFDEALVEITEWFRAFHESADMYETCRRHVGQYAKRARELEVEWAGQQVA